MCMMCMLMHNVGHSEHSTQGVPSTDFGSDNRSLLTVLKRRYALGEINTAQFEEMKRVLGLTDTAPTAVSGPEHAHQQ